MKPDLTMKTIGLIIFTFLCVAGFSFPNKSLAQNFVHYMTLTGHEDTVSSVAFSPDACILASGSMDRTVKFWDTETGEITRNLVRHVRVHSVAFSPDGQIVASGGADRILKLWKTETGASFRSLARHMSAIHSVAFSRDGITLASGSMDQTIRLWNVKTGRPIAMNPLPGHRSAIMSVAFHPFGRMFASAGADKAIKLWEAQTGALVKEFTAEAKIWSVVFSPDGQTLAAATINKNIELWDVNTGKLLRKFIGHNNVVHSVVFSPDGHTLASGSADHTVRLWNVYDGTQNQTLGGHTKQVMSVVFSPDGQTLASGSMDTTIRLWRATTTAQNQITNTAPQTSKIESNQTQNRTLDPPHSARPKKTMNPGYNTAIHGVVWIVNPWKGDCNGVLIDEPAKLVATLAHITGTQDTVDVYFPARNTSNALIKDPNYYLANKNSLKGTGYFTKAHVVTKNEGIGLVIIRLDKIPENARQIKWNISTALPRSGDQVYSLGSPDELDLWGWTRGIVKKMMKTLGRYNHKALLVIWAAQYLTNKTF